MLAAAVDHPDTTWSARQSSDKIQIGDKVVFWMSGEHAGAYALGEVTAPSQDMAEDPTFVPFWVDPSEASKTEARIRARQDRLLIMYPVLRQVAQEDPALKEMLVIKRPAGTVFSMSEAHYRRLIEVADSRPKVWSREELVLALDLYFKAKAGAVSNQAAVRRRLGRLCDRSADAYEFRLGNFKFLDTGQGFPNVGQDAREIWDEFAGNADLTSLAAKEIEAGLLEGGGVSFVADELRFIRSVGELRLSVARFHRDANKATGRSSNLARQTTYWVCDPEANTFGPAHPAFGWLG